jgi:hypothetical protein
MGRNKTDKLTPAKSLDELVESFDTQDMGDLWEQMPVAHFDVSIGRSTHLIEIDDKLAHELTEIAKSKRTSSEALINDWLKEKIARQKTLR